MVVIRKNVKIIFIIFSLCLFHNYGFTKKIKKTKEKIVRKAKIYLKIFPAKYKLEVDGNLVINKKNNKNLITIYITKGIHKIKISSKNYLSKSININIKKSFLLEEKLEKMSSQLKLIKELKTGIKPKSVEFTPDGKYFISALLEGRGADVFSVDNLAKVTTLIPPKKWAKKKGFVEVNFVKRLNEIWVSQMTTGYIHIFNLNNFKYKMSFHAKGFWTKVIAFTHDEKYAFISHWVTKSISIIDVTKKKVLKVFKTNGVPRGLVVTPDDKYLYICLYDGLGKIQKYDIVKRKIVKTLSIRKGAKRHAVMDNERKILYVSDMITNSVFVINTTNDRLIKEIYVDKKLNTIALSVNKQYLFVSSRGPNNAESYLKKGPKFGKIYVIDTFKKKVVEWIWGRNQPTGLGVSEDGRYLAFTDFLDHNVELYEIKKTQKVVSLK